MPSVVTYWQLPEDEQEFIAFLESTGTVEALLTHWVAREEELSPQSIASFIRELDPSAVSIGLQELILEQGITSQEFDGKLLYGLPTMQSNVIGYSRGRLQDGRLSLSNLAAYWDFPNDDATKMVKKDECFVQWAKKVLAWVRRKTPYRITCNGFPYRATRSAYQAVAAENVQAVIY